MVFYTRKDLDKLTRENTNVGMIPILQSIESGVVWYENMIGVSSC